MGIPLPFLSRCRAEFIRLRAGFIGTKATRLNKAGAVRGLNSCRKDLLGRVSTRVSPLLRSNLADHFRHLVRARCEFGMKFLVTVSFPSTQKCFVLHLNGSFGQTRPSGSTGQLSAKEGGQTPYWDRCARSGRSGEESLKCVHSIAVEGCNMKPGESSSVHHVKGSAPSVPPAART